MASTTHHHRPRLDPLTIGIDIGGTKVLAGVVRSDGQVLESLRRDTPTKSPTEVEDTIAEVVFDLSTRHDVAAVGIGAAGFVDSSRSSVLFAPHLAWRREPLRDALTNRLRMPVVVDNDANAAAWAESRFGAGAGEAHLLCVNLGTGIGGAMVIEGRIFRGAFGLAGEFGHMQVVEGGHRCECGNRGCWEQYASGNALVREARELVAAESPVAHYLRDVVDGDPARLTGPLVTQAATDGDPAAVELLGDVGRWLGVGLANLSAAFDPSCIVVGGGVCEAGELLLAPTREAYRRTLTGRGFRPEPRIVRAHLGSEAGLVGAGDLARTAGRRSRRRLRRRRARLHSRRALLRADRSRG
ncbi:MAG: ROK family glucokinase [Propionibacteriales bacterium]|nr:ROK family glucokinase [Propionibacteriales bacterium]